MGFCWALWEQLIEGIVVYQNLLGLLYRHTRENKNKVVVNGESRVQVLLHQLAEDFL